MAGEQSPVVPENIVASEVACVMRSPGFEPSWDSHETAVKPR
jgi:hypothetical protein